MMQGMFYNNPVDPNRIPFALNQAEANAFMKMQNMGLAYLKNKQFPTPIRTKKIIEAEQAGENMDAYDAENVMIHSHGENVTGMHDHGDGNSHSHSGQSGTDTGVTNTGGTTTGGTTLGSSVHGTGSYNKPDPNPPQDPQDENVGTSGMTYGNVINRAQGGLVSMNYLTRRL